MKELLEKYRQEFMIATLSNYLDADDKEFGVEYFKYEWEDFKETVEELILYYEKTIGNITKDTLLVIVVTGWCYGISCEDDMDKKKIKNLCEKIVAERYKGR